MSGALLPASEARRGHAFVAGLVARGSTDINRALLEAAASADPDRTTILLMLTDGLPTAGETDPERIVDNARRSIPDSVRLFNFGIGYDVDAVLLDTLSSEQRGTSGYVRPEERVDEAVSEFYSKVDAPVLTDVRLAFTGVHVEDLYPYPAPDLFAGTQLAVLGRYRDGRAGELVLSGQVGERSQSYRYTGLGFAKRGGEEFIARLWAQRKIGYLLAQIRLNGPSDEVIAEIIDLSTRYGIVTPYTSFLVEEPELALSREGRRELVQAAQAPGSDAGIGGAAQPRSGAAAVERAVAEKQMAASDQATYGSGSPAGGQVKHVGDVTFLLREETWTDTRFDASAMSAEKVVFGSARYFELLRRTPELGRFLALGDRVIVLVGKSALEIVPS
jgi:Ca-activated chloride channel family protein